MIYKYSFFYFSGRKMGSNMFASGLVLKTESIENEGGTQGKLESSYRYIIYIFNQRPLPNT